MNKAISISVLGIIVVFSVISLSAQKLNSKKDVYAKIVPIGGKVTTTERESGEEIPTRKRILIFQRIDCKNCFFAIFTDNDGLYSAYLSDGKYRIIVADCGKNKNEDCIAPNQPRILKVTTKNTPQFDIKLIHNKDDGVITLPSGLILPKLRPTK